MIIGEINAFYGMLFFCDVGIMIRVKKMYYLKHFDENLLSFDMFYDERGFGVENITLLSDESLLPLGLMLNKEGLVRFIKHRIIPKNRAYADKILAKLSLNHNNLKGIIDISKGLSLNDSYWIAEESFDKSFASINLFENRFSRTLSFLAFTGNSSGSVKGLSSSPELTTNGQLAKGWRRIDGKIFLYKSGTSGFANAGLEPYSEFYASQIAEAMGVNHVEYGLAKWKHKLCSTCTLFTSIDLSFVPMGYIVPSGGMAAVMEYLSKLGESFYEPFLDMLTFDAIILNTDRHYGNFGLLIDSKSNKPVAFAPLFDNGAGLLPYAMDEDELSSKEKLSVYLKSRTPAAYDSFLGLAKKYMGKSQREKIRNLLDFHFKKHARYNLSDKRLKILEEVVKNQAIELLK